MVVSGARPSDGIGISYVAAHDFLVFSAVVYKWLARRPVHCPRSSRQSTPLLSGGMMWGSSKNDKQPIQILWLV